MFAARGGGVILCTLNASNPSLAATTNRRNNIKSHGALQYKDETGNDVYLDTQDLYFLSDEVDALENGYKSSLKSALQSIGQNPSSDDWNTLLNGVRQGGQKQLREVITTSSPHNPNKNKYMCFAVIFVHHTGGVLLYFQDGGYGYRSLPYNPSDTYLNSISTDNFDASVYYWCLK